MGLGTDWLTVAGRASLVPTWFLATYLVVVACVPFTLWLWKTCGLWSVLAGLAATALLDLASVVIGQENVAFSQRPAGAWCARSRVWKLVIAAESRVMTIYFWHLTALGLLAALSLHLGGRGLGSFPDTVDWWVTRPAWFLALGLVTFLLTAVLGRLELPARRAYDERRPGWPLLEIAVTTIALAAMASGGVIDSEGRVRWYLPLVPVLVYAATWLRSPASTSGPAYRLVAGVDGGDGHRGNQAEKPPQR